MLFIHNKYTQWYNNIIDNAKSKPTADVNASYTERHHIIPKSLGGDNSLGNFVKLSGREHFICHWLLTKMTQGPNKRLMVYAFHSMSMVNEHTKERYFNSRAYNFNKQLLAKYKSTLMLESNPMSDPVTRQKHATAILKRGATLGTTGLTHSVETKQKMREARLGHKMSDITKEKLSQHNKAVWADRRLKGLDKRKPLSEITKRKISETLKERNRIKKIALLNV